MSLSVGSRVRVVDNHPWAAGSVGTVAAGRGDIELPAGEWLNDVVHRVPTPRGTSDWVLVNFDELRCDADGDGPFAGSMIDLDDLIAVSNGREG